MNDKFIKYCAEVMGYILAKNQYSESGYAHYIKDYGWRYYSPYDDLNQRIPVFDALYDKNATDKQRMEFNYNVNQHGIDKATKDFIILIMEKE